MTSKLLLLAGLGGAAYFAHKNGYLSQLIDPMKSQFSDFFDGFEGEEIAGGDISNVIIDGDSTNAVDVPEVSTSGGVTDTAEQSLFVQMLRENEYDLNPWAAQNLYWTAAICMQENRRRDPAARGSAGELGVMQVKPGTAGDLVRWGYGKYPATAEVLTTVAGGLYFGTAYLDYLSKKNANRSWITKAYNGGPGFASLSADYIRAREAYLEGVERNYNAIRGAQRVVSQAALNNREAVIHTETFGQNADGTLWAISDDSEGMHRPEAMV